MSNYHKAQMDEQDIATHKYRTLQSGRSLSDYIDEIDYHHDPVEPGPRLDRAQKEIDARMAELEKEAMAS
jgi:hypothetical protein